MQSIATNPMVQPNLVTSINSMETCVNNLITAFSKRMTAFCKKVVLPFGVLIAFLFSGVAAMAQTCPTSVQGSIQGNSGSPICSGDFASINISVTPANGGTYSGSFANSPYTFEGLTPASGFITPSFQLFNNGVSSQTVTFQLSSLVFTPTGGSPCTTGVMTQLNGQTQVVVQPVPNLAAMLTTPPNICRGGSVSINISQPNGVGGTYSRMIAYNGATGNFNATPNAGSQPYGIFNDVLNNTTTAPITVVYTFTPNGPGSLNCAGAPVSVSVTVNPNPTISCPANVTIGTDAGVCTAVVDGIDPTFAPAMCNGVAPTITYTFTGATATPMNNTGSASGKTFNKGITTVTYSITDAAGNTGTPCNFTVTVFDDEAPVFTNTLQMDISVTSSSDGTGNCSAVVNYPPYTATDNCVATPTITYSKASGTPFPVGTTTVTVTATDNNTPTPNTTTDQFTVTVLDNEAPVVTCPANITANNSAAPNDCGASVPFAVMSATDNCSAVVVYTIPGTPSPMVITSPYIFPVGTTTVTATATDPATNSATCTFTVTVNDITGNLYVNDGSPTGDHYTLAAGDDINGNGTRCKPYATIGKAITVAAAGNTIFVDAGTYPENPTVNKTLTINGSNMGTAGSGTRSFAESIVRPNGNVGNVFTVSANNVTFDGFTIDGDDPAVTGTATAAGTDGNAAQGIRNSGSINNLTVKNNIIKNVGIGVRGDNASPTNLITANLFDAIGAYDYGYAISLRVNFYADVINNKMTRVWSGLHVNNHNGPGGPATWTMSGNEVHSYAGGLLYWLNFNGATGLTVNNNQFSAETGAVTNNIGISVVTLNDAVNATFTNNTITGTEYGMTFTGVNTTNSPVLGNTNTISGTTKAAVLVTSNMGFNPVGTTALGPAASNQPSTVNINGIGITATSGNGIEVVGVTAPVSTINVTAATTITGGTTGLLVNGTNTAITGNTINNLNFAGQSGNYITLSNSALDNLTLTATGSSFDGSTGGTKTLAQNFATEDKITHAIDNASLGFVLVKTGNDFVTTNSGSIQRGVDEASAAFTVNVNTGTFIEDVDVNKQITLLGAGYTIPSTPANTTTVSGAIGGNATTIRITATGAIVDGFKITREGNNPTDYYNPNLNSAGVAVQGQTISSEIRNNWFFGNRTGIDINNSNGNNIHNNLIESNRTGLIFRNQTDNTNVQQNFIRDNFTVGIVFLDGSNGSNSPVQTAANSSFNFNFISGNWYGDVVDRQSGGSLPAPGTTNLKNFECNWYGQSSQPTVTTNNSTEPGYGTSGLSNIPTIFGGTAAAPLTPQPDIAGPASANIDYTPWLVNGTDNDPIIPGFQPVPMSCTGTPVVIASAVPSPETCGGNNGSIVVTYNGGTGPYSISYNRTSPVTPVVSGSASNISNPYTIFNLPAGTYTITITDFNGSTATTMATITYNPVTNVTQTTTYTSIQAAVNAANANDVLQVCAGTYKENVTVNKPLDIRGPNYNISPNGGTRVPEAIVVPATDNVTAGIVFDVQSSDVSINGFIIDGGGNTALMDNGFGTNGADQHAADGVAINQNNINRLTVKNNIIKNLSYSAVDLYGVDGNTPATTGHTITGNRMEDLGNYVQASGISNWGIGVILYNNHYADVENNTMINVRNGIQTGNFVQLNPGMAQFQTLSNNTINPRRRGVFHNEIYLGSSPFTIANNNITAVSSSFDVLWQGIFISSHFSATSTVQNNVINGTAILSPSVESYGIEVWNVDPSNPALISGGSVTGVNKGILVTNYDNQFGDGPLTVGAKASLSSISFTNCVTGITVSDNTASTAHMPVSLSVGTGITVSNATTGFVLENSAATITPVSGVSSLSDLSFSTISGKYINLVANATNLDATAVVFDGITGASAPMLTDNFAIEDKINHKIDLVTLGFVTVKANNTFVTPSSFVAPNTEAKIQRGVDAAGLTGFTENVQNGTYNDNVNVNKEIIITGQSQAGVFVYPATSNPNCGGAGGGSLCGGTSSNLFLVQANNVTIQQLTLDGNNTAITSNTTSNGVDVDARNGIITDHNSMPLVTGLNVNNVTVKNMFLRGIYASTDNGTFNFNTNTVTNVAGLAGESFGILNFGGSGSITNNNVSGSYAGIGTQNSFGTTFTGNTVTDCIRGIEVDNAGAAGGSGADLVTNNTVTNTGTGVANSFGITVFNPYVAPTVQENTVTNVQTGLANVAQVVAVTPVFTRNTVNGNNRANSIGILQTTSSPFGNTNVSGTFTNNFIQNNAVGFRVEYPTNTNTITANNNSITGNTTGVQLVTGTGTLVNNFTCNWWGSNNAATVAAAVGQPSNVINYIPYLSDGTDADMSMAGFQPSVPCTGACTGNVTATVTQTMSTCANDNPPTGRLTVTGTTGGTGPYTFTISGPTVNTTGATSGVFTDLSQGFYTITVFQATGCSTALAAVEVRDQIAPTFNVCPAPVTGQMPNTSNCQASVDPPDPTAMDNCTPPAITYVLKNAMGTTIGSGTAPIGAMNFNVGTTTIIYTATDQSGNTATCSTSVTVVNNLAGNITGTATVAQNNAATSNITFSGSGGTKPYKFTYNVTVDNNATGGNQTVSTTNNNSIVTVPQSNAVTGQFVYTLVSIQDANGCFGTLPIDRKDTITVVTSIPRPDLFSTIDYPLNSSFSSMQTKEGVITIGNASADPTTGIIEFRISNVENFEIELLESTTVPGLSGPPDNVGPVNNSQFTFTPGLFFTTVTSKEGVVIGGNSSKKIGYKIKAVGSAGTRGVMTLSILDNTGGSSSTNGDSGNFNNQSTKGFSIN